MEPGAEMAESLPTTTEQPTQNGGGSGPAGGLAAEVAREHGADTSGSPESVSAAPKRRGRPPIHGRYSKFGPVAGEGGTKDIPSGSGQMAPGENPPGVSIRSVIPSDLLAKVVKESLTLGENFAASMIEAQARKAGLSAAEIEPQIKQTLLGDSRKQIVADLAPLVLEEHGIDANLSPSVAVSALLAPWLFSAVTAYSTLAKLAKERAEMDATGTP